MPTQLASCKREAINSFGDDAVLIEKYVQRPRHIEIQVFGDTQGNYVYLFERDCSVQRRHQKVLEEAPAPGMTPALRAQMGQAAVEAARAVNYVGAGTVEFIVEQPGGYEHPEAMKFYFMEMNTRLQVEHPVTEAITGLDWWSGSCAWPVASRCLCAKTSCRSTATPSRPVFAPRTPTTTSSRPPGSLQVYGLPPHVTFARAERGVRVDSGVREGDAISPFYDSMVAKLIVHGATREEALARLDAALAQTHIVGLATNVQFLRHVTTSASFAAAQAGYGADSARSRRLVPPRQSGPAHGRGGLDRPHFAGGRTPSRAARCPWLARPLGAARWLEIATAPKCAALPSNTPASRTLPCCAQCAVARWS